MIFQGSVKYHGKQEASEKECERERSYHRKALATGIKDVGRVEM